MKAVIFDLDNTLLRRDKTISDYSRRVIQRCRERGILVMAASARPERSIAEFCPGIKFDAAATLNGARVLLPGGVVENTIPRDVGERITAELMRLPDTVISAEMSGGIFSTRPVPEWSSTVYNGFPQLPEGRLYKLLISGAALDDVSGVLTGGTYCTPIEGGRLIQVMSRKATKWRGTFLMLSRFGIEPKDVAYFGDDWDDVEPVRRCGLGVAMENAIDEVKAASDALTGDCDRDGAARFVDREILK